MGSHTNPNHLRQRMFELWSALSKVVWDCGEFLGPEPWESTNDEVRTAWGALTQPSNLEGLELWASGNLNKAAREATDRALLACRSRAADPASFTSNVQNPESLSR